MNIGRIVFAQLIYRKSLRDIEACLCAVSSKLYHMGIRGKVSRSTLTDTNESRDWRIYADFSQVLIHIARRLYINYEFGVESNQKVYALDSTTIDLCLSLCPRVIFQRHKGAIKLHMLLDLRGNIPSFIKIIEGIFHDVKILDELIQASGSFYVMAIYVYVLVAIIRRELYLDLSLYTNVAIGSSLEI